MINAHIEYEKVQNDLIMHRLAWQTSIIINCMGTLKKKINPKDLYSTDDEDDGKGYTILEEEEHKQLQNDLLQTFNLN